MSEKQKIQSVIGNVDAMRKWFLRHEGMDGSLTGTDRTRPAGAEVKNMTDLEDLRQLLWSLEQFVQAVSTAVLIHLDDEPAEMNLERVR